MLHASGVSINKASQKPWIWIDTPHTNGHQSTKLVITTAILLQYWYYFLVLLLLSPATLDLGLYNAYMPA